MFSECVRKVKRARTIAYLCGAVFYILGMIFIDEVGLFIMIASVVIAALIYFRYKKETLQSTLDEYMRMWNDKAKIITGACSKCKGENMSVADCKVPEVIGKHIFYEDECLCASCAFLLDAVPSDKEKLFKNHE